MSKNKSFLNFFYESEFWREVSVNVVSGIALAVLTFTAAQTPWVYGKLKEMAVQLSTASEDPAVVLPIAQKAYSQGDFQKVLAVSQDVVAAPSDVQFQKVINLRSEATQKLQTAGFDTVYTAAANPSYLNVSAENKPESV